MEPDSDQFETTEDPSAAQEPPVKLQTPPVKLRMYGASVSVAMIGLGNGYFGQYLSQTEYWRGSEALRVTSDLTLEAFPVGAETDRSIDAWFGGLTPSFSTRRQVAAAEWAKGVPTTAPAGTSYLLWTPHPDDSAEVLALQLVVNTQGRLASAIWYRSSPPASNGLAFRSNTWTQTMRLLVGPDGAPASDPNLIQAADWHYIVMPLPPP